MHIYLKNNRAKFHLDPIWNDRALGFFEETTPHYLKIHSVDRKLLLTEPTHGGMATGQAELTWVAGYIPRWYQAHTND